MSTNKNSNEYKAYSNQYDKNFGKASREEVKEAVFEMSKAAGEKLLDKEVEISNLKAKIQNFKQENEKLKAQNKGLQAENKGLKAGKASLEKEIDKSKAETSFLKDENGKLKEHNAKLQQQPKTREEVKKARKQAEIDAKAEKKAAKTQKKVEKAENKNVRFKASNDKVSEKTVASAKDKIAKSNVVLKAKNSYRSRFQKTRAVLKTVNSVTLKPAAQFTMKQFKQRKQTYGVIKDKVTTELKKKGVENPSVGQYRAKFAQVAAAKAGKKVMNKTVNTTLKDVWNKVTGVYKGSIEADKAKVAANNKQIEKNNEPKQAKINAKATIKAEKSLSI
ncbi:hypothetical protein [Priestia megaterium]|uniref:Uncharacterized protein n=1 Tax=Priestia megaterium TaxID=1404 RepID=A0A6M6E5U2_PRIMG|nr:hypothetical protein [Priestia megaterium]QJX80894.1 hypothetical protein FDZ14_32915 [Priestia megaterium]